MPSPSPPTAPPACTFRPAMEDDAKAISQLIGSTWAEFFAYSVSPEDLAYYLEVTVSEEAIRREIQKVDQTRFYVAVTPSPAQSTSLPGHLGIVGVSQLNLKTSHSSLSDPQAVELNRFYLHSSQHGSGLAKALMEYTTQQAQTQAKRESMWLGVWEENHRGIGFYTKMGFEKRGEKVFLLGEKKRTDWVMEKRIGI